jgi:hypothetical protein
MKTRLTKSASTFLLVIFCWLQFDFIQTDNTQILKNLNKGTIFLKENRIIKNIHLIQINDLFIVYEKEGNLHDLMKDEINRIEFMNANPKPITIEFENNIAVFNELQYKIH